MDSSFGNLAKLFDETGKVRVVFRKGAQPNTNTATKVITLPSEAEKIDINKRFELLGYLMHEVGHLLHTNGPMKSGHPKMENLLEDLLIQEKVEKLMSGSRDIYDLIVEINTKRNAEYYDKKLCTIEQVFFDHIQLVENDLTKYSYNKEMLDKLMVHRNRLTNIIVSYTDARNRNNEYDIKDAVKRLVVYYEFVTGEEERKKSAENKQQAQKDANENQSKVDDKRIETNNKLANEKSSNEEKIKDAKEESKQLKKDIKKEKADVKSGKTEDWEGSIEKQKAMSQKIEDNKQKEKELDQRNENIQQSVEAGEDGSYDTSDWDEFNDAKKELKQSIKDLDNMNSSSCNGLNKIKTDKEFFQSVPKLKESVLSAMRRLFKGLEEARVKNEKGFLNTNALARFHDPDELFMEIQEVEDIKATIGFALDKSGSMKRKRDQLWQHFDKVITSIDRIRSSQSHDIDYCVRGFATNDHSIKSLREKHSKAMIEKMRERYRDYHVGNGTRLEETLKELVREVGKDVRRKRIIFIFTDGSVTDSPKIIESGIVDRALKSGIKIIFMGYGSYVPDNFLGKFSTVPINQIEDLNKCLVDQISKAFR